MGEAKHTPGSWSLGDLDHNGQRVVRAEHIEVATCWHHCVGGLEAQMEANARLIAASPDLLEALDWLVGCLGDGSLQNDGGFYLAKARAAIAKATGSDQ